MFNLSESSGNEMFIRVLLKLVLFSGLLFSTGFVHAQNAKVHLLPCNCEPENFKSVAYSVEEGFVYVYNKPEDGVRVFRVIRNRESGNNIVSVTELGNPDQQIISALTSVLQRVSTIKSAQSANDFESLEGVDSAVDLAGRRAMQQELGFEISNIIQSTIKSDLRFLFERTYNSNQVTQALGWGSTKGKKITFSDGSYIKLKFSDAILYDDGNIDFEFEVVHIVDADGQFVGETKADYRGRQLSGAESYINHYRSLVSRLGFSVSVGCTGTGSASMSCDSTGASCTVVYHKPSC